MCRQRVEFLKPTACVTRVVFRATSRKAQEYPSLPASLRMRTPCPAAKTDDCWLVQVLSSVQSTSALPATAVITIGLSLGSPGTMGGTLAGTSCVALVASGRAMGRAGFTPTGDRRLARRTEFLERQGCAVKGLSS